MNCDEARQRFASLNVWRRGGERAPHKPLLLLLTLARVARGGERLVAFAEVEDPLRKLLVEFGPPRKTQPHLPFWHLRSDGIWEVVGVPGGDERAPGDTPLVSELRSPPVRAGLTQELDRLLRSDPDCLRDLARRLLESSFPESLHDEIANAVGLDLTDRTTRPRDHRFRERVLIAYGYRCAVCGYNLRVHDALVGLEAAHIKWHQAGGPSTEENGLALCTLHHKLFDRGAIGLDPDRRVVVSPLVNGSPESEEWVMRFDRQPIRQPREPGHLPLEEFVRWHVLQVFKARS